jgi:hypothetical protein
VGLSLAKTLSASQTARNQRFVSIWRWEGRGRFEVVSPITTAVTTTFREQTTISSRCLSLSGFSV